MTEEDAGKVVNKNLPSLIDEAFQEIAKMSRKELEQEVDTWRFLWNALDPNTKYLINSLGSLVRIIKRDYKGILGILRRVEFEPFKYEIIVDTKEYEYSKGKWVRELKIARIEAGSVFTVERILQQEEIPEPTIPA